MSDEDLPKLVSEDQLATKNDENSDNSDEEGWEETEDQTEPTKCLFCEVTENSIEDSIQHLKDSHNFSLAELKEKFQMDQYSFIKLVNCIRHEGINDLQKLVNSQSSFWDDEKYLKPVEYESWLSYDFENLKMENPKSPEAESEKQTIENLMAIIKQKDEMLEQAMSNIETMKKSFRHLLSKEDSSVDKTEKKKRSGVENGVASVDLKDDEGYFNSYSHFSIHHSMLSDTVRTESYRDAILKNASVLKDKLVMDLGSGTSILSMFASQAGAKTVYCVDQSDIIYKAMEIVTTNSFENIQFVKGRIEDIKDFPVEKVDVIISEWMGYFLLFEGMLDSVIYARKNYLKESGILMPNRCNISILAYGDEERYNKLILFFKDVYSFNMSCMIPEMLKEAHIETCDSQYVLSSRNIIADLDLMTVDINCPNFTYNFSLQIIKKGSITSLVGYFDTFFELPENVQFSTSPFAKGTHWKQTVFYLDKMYKVNVGETIEGTIRCRRDPKDLRSLKISIDIFGKTFNYDLN